MGTSQKVAEASKLKPYPTNVFRIKDHLEALVIRYADLSNAIRHDIDSVELEGDLDSVDILIAFSRTLDKSVWFLRSHLE